MSLAVLADITRDMARELAVNAGVCVRPLVRRVLDRDTGTRRQGERGILDRAGDRAFEQERRGAGKRVGPGDERYAPERLLVAVDAAP